MSHIPQYLVGQINDADALNVLVDQINLNESSGGGGTEISKLQVAHGLSLLEPIYHDGSSWLKAKANDGETLGEYVVTEVVDVDNFVATKFGEVEITAHGLTVGEYYFTSDTVAGEITSTEPSEYSNPVLYVENANIIHVTVYRPSGSGSSPVSSESIIGDIRHSMLTEVQFQSELDVTWVLADGRSVTGSIYESLTGNSNIPDMRGQFLRGKNNGRSDGSENTNGDLNLGNFETDKSNYFVGVEQIGGATTSGARVIPEDGSYSTFLGSAHGADQVRYKNSGDETRPRNITVNIFIKINN